MLAKKHRLPLQYFYKKPGKAVKNSFFIVKVMPSDLPFSRFGVIVGSGVCKRAVQRNALKRAAYRGIQKSGLPRYPGKNVMITVLPPACDLTQREIAKTLGELFSGMFPLKT